MANASSELQWLLVRKHNSFLVRRDGATFSREANNLINKNSSRFSGLVNKRTVGVSVNEKGAVVVTHRKTNAGRGRIASGAASTTIRNVNFKRVAKNVKAAAKGSHVEKAALARWTKIDRSLKAQKKIQKKAAAAAVAPSPN